MEFFGKDPLLENVATSFASSQDPLSLVSPSSAYLFLAAVGLLHGVRARNRPPSLVTADRRRYWRIYLDPGGQEDPGC